MSLPAVIAAFRHQAEWCDRLGSPFTARALRLLVADMAAGEGLAAMLADWPGDPQSDVLALRVMGALHALVLSGADAALAECYPPRATDDARLGAALRGALARHGAHIRGFLASAPQTNEVARAGVLLGGYLTVAARTRLPLRVLEIGASAGLNLLWDRFHYALGEAEWGDPASAVRLAPEWQGGLPPLGAAVAVVARKGCDLAPVDVTDPAARLRLRAYVWPDQTARRARLDGALALAARDVPPVEALGAADFLARELAAAMPGAATVIVHSIMWNYMREAERAAVSAGIAAAGARATRAAPLAWLRFEIPAADALPVLDLTLWPGGTRERLATANPHGAAVTWHGVA